MIAIVALTAGATLLVIHLASPRLPGQPETGSAPQNLAKEVQTQLAEASILVEEGRHTLVVRDSGRETTHEPLKLAAGETVVRGG